MFDFVIKIFLIYIFVFIIFFDEIWYSWFLIGYKFGGFGYVRYVINFSGYNLMILFLLYKFIVIIFLIIEKYVYGRINLSYYNVVEKIDI